jgi:hypothetical protein
MKRIGYSIGLILLAALVLAPGPTLTAQTTDPHAYFKALVARSDHWKSFSLRDSAQIELYRQSRSLPAAVTYDYANDPDPRRQDAAKVVIPATTNSLPTQVWLPFGSEDGHSYLTTWDVWYGRETAAALTGLANWKTFQFDFPRTAGGRPTIWAEVQTRFDQAGSSSDLAAVRMRQYATSTLSGVTQLDPVSPVAGTFMLKPEVWTRYWTLIEMPAFGTGDVRITLWMADVNRGPVKVLDRVPWKRDVSGKIEKFWIEFNTSTDEVAPGRGALVNYVRNVAMLRDVADPTTLLQRPYSTATPPPTSGPAAPQNLRIVQ